MWKFIILIFASITVSSCSFAQVPGETPSGEVLQSCLMGTTDDIWKELELSYDQTRRIHFVQEACKEECNSAKANDQPNPISTADGSTILSEVEHILTREQYKKWVSYCAGDTTPKERK